MKRPKIIEIITYLFILLFLYTGVSKFMDFSIFREQIATSPILSPFASWIAILLPAAEIIASIILFFPVTRLAGLYASTILMILFTGYVIYILNFNEHLPCTCGGFIEALTWKQHLLFNIAFVVLGISAIILRRRSAGSRQDNTQFAHG